MRMTEIVSTRTRANGSIAEVAVGLGVRDGKALFSSWAISVPVQDNGSTMEVTGRQGPSFCSAFVQDLAHSLVPGWSSRGL